ncbi:MAG: phosphotransferase [Candidatus Paceibacterota bacterium]
MKFEDQIMIKGKIYTHVDTQRDGMSAVYKDDSVYVRIGDREKIKRDLMLHKNMESAGFPVAELLDEGEIEDMYFFIETSLGDKNFGLIFKEETEKFGEIKDETFDAFISICVQFAEAQLKRLPSKKSWVDFEKGIHLDLICKELPKEAKNIKKKIKEIKKNLMKLPFVLSHGDFTPFNIYPKGIIDFEDSLIAPFGYDVGSILGHLNWFPESNMYEYYQLYCFSNVQREKYYEAINKVYLKNNFPPFSTFLRDYDFVKGIWFAVRMERAPKLQQYRYDLLRKII